MTTKNIKDYRNEVRTDLKYIKEKIDKCECHLEKVNGRLTRAEHSITAIKTIGTTITFVIGTILTWFKLGD